MFGLLFQEIRFVSEIIAWVSGAGAVFVIAVGVGVYVKEWRQTAFAVAIFSLLSGYMMTKGVYLGHAFEKAARERAEIATEKLAVDAHEDAVRSVNADTGVGGAGRVRVNDHYNRDQWKHAVHGVAPDHLLKQR